MDLRQFISFQIELITYIEKKTSVFVLLTVNVESGAQRGWLAGVHPAPNPILGFDSTTVLGISRTFRDIEMKSAQSLTFEPAEMERATIRIPE